MQSFQGVDATYEGTVGDSSTERLIMQELEMKNGLEAMLADQRITAEKYKANFSFLEAQHVQLQSETQQLKDDMAQKDLQLKNYGKKFENQITQLETERDRLLLEVESMKSKVMTPAKLENLRQSLLRDVEMIYKQHLAQTEDEVEAYRKELNKLKFDYNFVKTEYENCQNEYSQKLEDIHAKYKLDIDTLQRKCESLKKSLEQKGAAAQESISLVKENTKMSAKIKSLISENDSYRKQIAEECRKGDERVVKVSTQLSELHVKHEIVNNDNKTMASRIEKLQDKLEQANNDLTKQIPHVSKLEDQVMKLSSDIEDLNQKHKMELSMSENNYKRQLSDAKKETDDVQSKLADTRTQTEFMTKTIDQLKSNLRQKEKDFAEKLQAVKDQQWDSVNRANQEKTAAEAKIIAAEKLHSDQIHSLNIELEKSKNNHESLNSAIQAKSKEISTLEAQVNKLKSSIESKDKDLSHYHRIELEMQSLESQLKASNSQYKEEVIECDKLKGQNKLANEEISTLRNQIQDMKAEFEKVCQANKSAWEKENEAINDKYQSLKKRVNKGEKRRETILNLAKKQKSQYQKEIDALKDSVICCQAREKQYELEKESLRKNHELEVNKLRRHIEQFKVRATEFESLLYNPIASNSGNVTSMPIPDSFSTIAATTKEQQHELAEISKNLNDFQEKQADLEKVV